MTGTPAGLAAWVQAQLRPSPDSAWLLQEHGYDPQRESGIESRFAISNGFLGVRGARAASRGPTWVSWLHHLSWASWPRTFVAGLFDTPNTEPAVPALVPAPDWLRFRLVVDGMPLGLRSGELLAHRRTLDLSRGVMLAEWAHRSGGARQMRLRALRLVSMAERSMGLQLVQFEFSHPGRVTFEAWLEVTNGGLEVVQVQPSLSVWRTAESGKRLAVASAGGLEIDGRAVDPTRQAHLTRVWTWDAVPDQPVTFWRLVSFARGDDPDDSPVRAARRAVARARVAGLPAVLEDHQRQWAERWALSDIQVEGDESAQRALRFAAYHLNSAANPEDERVSIAARALTGDAYLGHVFWDTEIYLLPFYTYTWPSAARALLMYRYHTLPAARAKAERLGYRGALYAWESADTGEETTPDVVIGPDGRPVAILAGRQEHHISADIAYGVWQYWQATRDRAFLLDAGAEILLETARFWASRARLEDDGRYHIRGVIGPDEYHDHVDDSAYTNGMARWNLGRGLEVAGLVAQSWPERWQALAQVLDLSPSELETWQVIAERLVTGVHTRTGHIEQFANYLSLEDIDLRQYDGRTVPMDVVLGRERTQASQVLKQADVVMLLALLPEAFDRQVQATNFAYYEPRCGHGSSLSRAMHAIVAARLGEADLAERYFRDTAATDLDDTTAGVAGGVRIAAMGGLWQVAVLGFGGFLPREDGLSFEPRLPPSWRTLSFRVQWRQRLVHVHIDGPGRLLAVTLETGEPIRVQVGERVRAVCVGEVWKVPIAQRLDRVA
jgi:trehalose/maltose hydrolase-like predicted phosphorylase